MRFWPLTLDLIDYSPVALFVFALSAVFGLACGLVWRCRQRTLNLLAAGLFVLAASVQWAGALTLWRDPMRDLGSIPLQYPFDEGAAWAAIALALVSPGVAAFIVTRVCVASPRPRVILRVTYWVLSIYAASVGPWALFVLFD